MKNEYIMDYTQYLKHFTPAEFTAVGCSIEDMSFSFLTTLDAIREFSGVPMRITSAFRTVEHERSVGRSGNSAHTRGFAVDIHCTNSSDRLKIVRYALAFGIRRIGIASTFIHLDSDPSLPECMWTY